MSEPEVATLKQFAEILGVRPSYVTKLKQEGRLVLTADERVRVAESLRLIEQTADPSRDHIRQRWDKYRKQAAGDAPAPAPAPAPQSAEIDRVGVTYQQARAVKERYLALQAKADYERLIGKLVEVERVRLAATEVGAVLRVTLENLADQLAQQLVGVTDYNRIYALLVDHFERVLADISAQLEEVLQREDPNEGRNPVDR